MFKKIVNRIRTLIWKSNHRRINRKERQRLRIKDTTILSMNCTGGILSYDLGLQFLSQTVNFF